jgi:hypothetical protein
MKSKCIKKITTLGWHQDNIVKNKLQSMCKEIEPILLRRKWVVHSLEEFYPNNPALLGLNVNRGRSIKIRCRTPRNRKVLFPDNEIMGTILHELAHITHGDHSAAFQKLWDELWEELKGYKRGDISFFNGCGCKLNTTKRNPDTIYEARTLAVKSANKRAKYQKMRVGSGSKLGGTQSKEKDPKKLAALAALSRFET